MPSLSRQKSSPSVHLLKANLMSKAVGSAFSTFAMASSVKPLAFSVVWLMRGRLRQRAVADRVGLDLGDVGFAIAERAQRFRHRAVDDLEVAAAGELLELHQREVGLDAGGVAIHHQADGAGGRDHGRLRVAVAVLLAERERAVPGRLGMRDQRLIGAGGVVERHRRRRNLLVAGALAVGGAAVVAHHAQHVLAVLLVAGEGPELLGHFGRGRVGHAGHDGGQRAADGAAGIGVIRDAGRSSAGRRYWRSRGRACGIRRTARRSACDGNCAIITEISRTTVHSRTACS